MEHFKKYFFYNYATSAAAAGFTLIEVLIAIAVLSFISLSTYKMIDSNTDTKDIVLKEDRELIQTLTAVARLDSDISQIYNPLFSEGINIPDAEATLSQAYVDNNNSNGPFNGKTKNGAPIPQFVSEDKSTIVFFTSANRRKIADSKESRFAWVRYSLRPMENNPDESDKKNNGQYELIRQSISNDIYNTSPLDWSKIKSQILMGQIKSLEFSFWDERSKKYTTSLQDLNENKNRVRSIKVNLVWINQDNNEQAIEKNFRVLSPYFNTKQDDLKIGAGFPKGGSFPADGQGSGQSSQDQDGI